MLYTTSVPKVIAVYKANWNQKRKLRQLKQQIEKQQHMQQHG